MTSKGGPVARSVFTFRATRQVLARRWAIPLFLLIAAVFAFAAMIMGGMLVFARTGYTHLTVIVLTTASGGAAWWNYPGVIVGFPNGGLFLPFFGTLTMLIVSIGVGAGMSVAVVLWTRLIRLRRLAASGNVAIGSMAGLTPAFLSLATIGACCTITTSTAAGLGVVAQTSGTTAYTLLANNWFLGVFEIVVLTIALLAHEALLETYGPLLGLTTSPNGRIVRLPDDLPTPAPLSGATVIRAVVRVVLLLGGVLWALAGVGLAATYNYPFSSASFWFAVLVQHEFIAAVAIFLAILPDAGSQGLRRASRSISGWGLRAALFVAGVSVVAWLPPVWLGTGAEGLFNEFFGMAGLPVSWGAVAPPYGMGVALVMRFVFQFGLMGSFALLLALAPTKALAWVSTDRRPVAERSGVAPTAGHPAGE